MPEFGSKMCPQRSKLPQVSIGLGIMTSSKVHLHRYGEITYPFPNFNRCTVDFLEWIK